MYVCSYYSIKYLQDCRFRTGILRWEMVKKRRRYEETKVGRLERIKRQRASTNDLKEAPGRRAGRRGRGGRGGDLIEDAW